MAVVVAAVAMSFISGSYRVTASAHLEGKVQRAIVAPFDGYIAAAHARAGETRDGRRYNRRTRYRGTRVTATALCR